MKILFYCDEYPPARNGGIGTVTKTVAEALSVRGHQVFVIGFCMKDAENLPFFSKINGVEIYRLKRNEFPLQKKTIDFLQKSLNLFVKQFTLKKRMRRIENFIEDFIHKHKIDILELPDYRNEIGYELREVINWKKFSIPTVYRIHGSASFVTQIFAGKIPSHILGNDIRNITRCDKISAVSQYSADWVKENFEIDKKTDVIYNPIENDYFQDIKPYPTKKQILYFGKLSELKGFYSLVEAYKIVAAQENESVLCIVGAKNEDEIESAKKLFSETVHNRLIFKKFMNKNELQNEIDNSYLCVLPSYAENFSMAALEVMARARLLIYTNRCSGAELVKDDANGLLVNPDNANEIAQKILYALNNPNKTQQMAKTGYEDCKKRFSTDVIIPQLEAYYQNIINNSK